MNKCLNCDKETTNTKFCSRSCGVSYNNTIRPKREKKEQTSVCKICGKLLENTQKRFCSMSCAAKYKADNSYKTYIERWKEGKENGSKGKGDYYFSGHVRRYMLEKNNYKCSKCGWGDTNPHTGKIPLEIDHIDGNWKNNKENNLQVICPNCHSLTETYRGANSGKGRGSSMRGSRLHQ